MEPGDRPSRPSALTQSSPPSFGGSEFGTLSAPKPCPSSPKVEPLGEIVGFSTPSPLPSSSSSPRDAVPRPLEALQSALIPPFLSKTYDLVDDPSLDALISWGSAGKSFVVWDPVEFARAILPRSFKHNNFSSFVRQLSTYRFRKIDADRWEFANEDFVRGNKPLLKNINRRRSYQVQQAATQIGSQAEMGNPELEGELHTLRKEKSALVQEVTRLQQEHLMTVRQMDALSQRMQSAEQRQKLMVSFLAKVPKNPVLLAHLKQLKERREIASARVRRKFLKQQLASLSDLDKSMEQQTGATASALHGIEFSAGKQLPDNPLQDMDETFGLDASRQDLLRGFDEIGLEVLDPFFLDPDSAAIKGDLPESTQIDLGFSGTECFASLPEDITPERMFSDAIVPVTESAGPEPGTATFKGVDIVDETEVTSGGSDYLISFPDDTSQEKMLSDAIASASKTVSGQEEIWNINLEAGECSLSSCQNVCDGLAHDVPSLELAAGPGALWDIDLQTLKEDLEFD